jgi:hypothetical protein
VGPANTALIKGREGINAYQSTFRQTKTPATVQVKKLVEKLSVKDRTKGQGGAQKTRNSTRKGTGKAEDGGKDERGKRITGG